MFGLSSAVVPIKVQASLVTLILILPGIKFWVYSNFIMVIRFIILVREATSRFLKCPFP